jgi:phenylacetate-CoA ligase
MRRPIEIKEYTFGISDIEKYCIDEVGRNFDTTKRQQEMLFWWRTNKEDLKKRQRSLYSELGNFQLNRLRFMVDYAFSTTPFYRRIYSNIGYELGALRTFDDFKKLPVIRKEDLISAFPHDIVSNNVNHEECYGLRTSGSSGKPVTIILNDDRARLDTAERLRQFETMMGGDFAPEDWIYNVHHCPWWFTSMAGELPTFTLSQECHSERFVEHLVRIPPKFVSGLPAISYV